MADGRPVEGPQDGETRGGDAQKAALRRAREAEKRLADIIAELRQLQSGNETHRERVTAELDERYSERRDRLLIASIGILEKLDRALDAARETGAPKALIEGLVLVRSLLVRIVQEEGLERVPVLGLPLDPLSSEVAGTRAVDDPARHQLVVEEVVTGHRIGGHIARRAQVIIGEYRPAARAPAAEEATAPPVAEAPAPEPMVAEAPAAPVAATPTEASSKAAAPEEAAPAVEPPPVEPSSIEAAPAEVAAAQVEVDLPEAETAEWTTIELPSGEPPAAAMEAPALEAPPAAAQPPIVPVAPVPPAVLPPPRPSRPGLYAALALVVIVAGALMAGRKWLRSSAEIRPTPTPRVALATPVPPQPSIAPSIAPAPTARPTAAAVEPPPPAPTLPRKPAPAPTVVPSPAPRVTPTPRASPAPRAAPTATPPAARHSEPTKEELAAAQVATLLTQADGAFAAHRYDEAVTLYDAALTLDARNQHAVDGRTRAVAARDLAKRKFVAGRTAVRTRETNKGLGGFETEDVQVSRAPRDSGRIDFETDPTSPKPGETYTLRVHLANLGKKGFRLESVTVTTVAGGVKSGGAVPVETREIGPGKRVLVLERSDVWPEGTTSWHAEVVVTTPHGETFTSRLDWK
jgi:molecular chaperone GrpE (heat shock protein)